MKLQAAVSLKPPCFTATNAQVLLPSTVNASQPRAASQHQSVLLSSVPELLFHEDTLNAVAVILQLVLNLPNLKLPYTSFSARLALELPLSAPMPQHVPVPIPALPRVIVPQQPCL